VFAKVSALKNINTFFHLGVISRSSMNSQERFLRAGAARQRRFDRMQKLRLRRSMRPVGSSNLGVRRGCELFGGLWFM
jgi:hypothetical protein